MARRQQGNVKSGEPPAQHKTQVERSAQDAPRWHSSSATVERAAYVYRFLFMIFLCFVSHNSNSGASVRQSTISHAVLGSVRFVLF